jgi:hypothetical protein
MMPAEIVAARIAMLADSVSEALDLLDQRVAAHSREVVIHGAFLTRQGG